MITIAECWTIAKEQQNLLEAAEVCFLRRVLKISGTHKVSSKDALIIARSNIPWVPEPQHLNERKLVPRVEVIGH